MEFRLWDKLSIYSTILAKWFEDVVASDELGEGIIHYLLLWHRMSATKTCDIVTTSGRIIFTITIGNI